MECKAGVIGQGTRKNQFRQWKSKDLLNVIVIDPAVYVYKTKQKLQN